uniref:Ring finger protein 24 n=1 Tax=Ficedula albicollis TaxID=59894 RepID=A0A803W8G3_FICAL
MSSDFQHYSFRMPNIGFQNLPLNIYIVVFGTAIFVFILSLLFCCYLIRLRHQAHKELYAYKQVILKEKVKELNLHEVSTSWGNKSSLTLLFLTLGRGQTLKFTSPGSRACSQLCFGNGERSSAKVWIKPSLSSWLPLGFPASSFISFFLSH